MSFSVVAHMPGEAEQFGQTVDSSAVLALAGRLAVVAAVDTAEGAEPFGAGQHSAVWTETHVFRDGISAIGASVRGGL